jgi:DNA-binding NarL/FixJ family response regulator
MMTMLDASQLVAAIMVDGMPDCGRFTDRLGTAIDAALAACEARSARVYSGAVQWLAARGELHAAVRLEFLFFGLARTHAFSLWCARAMAERYAESQSAIGAWRPLQSPSVPGAGPLVGVAGVRVESITKREEEVLRLASFGQANKDIAIALAISARTVEAHKANAMRKLGLRERADVVRFAVSQGWLAPGHASSNGAPPQWSRS